MSNSNQQNKKPGYSATPDNKQNQMGGKPQQQSGQSGFKGTPSQQSHGTGAGMGTQKTTQGDWQKNKQTGGATNSNFQQKDKNRKDKDSRDKF